MPKPNPRQLYVLTELRTAAGLTLAHMAERCGLPGSQSHQTAGAWERGVYIPSARRRTRMVGYLWDDLRLRTDPARFLEVWEILVSEWDWAPVTDEEWKALTIQPRPARGAVATAAPRPFQAPAHTAHFVGRGRERDETVRLLAGGGQQLVALVGMGGAGKTTLAIQAALQLRDEYVDGVLWAHARLSEPLDILNSWAKAFGHDYTGLRDVQSCAAAVRSLLVGKRLLVVLDDVAASARVAALLPGHAGCAVLLTAAKM